MTAPEPSSPAPGDLAGDDAGSRAASAEDAAPSVWSPLQGGVFRAIWIAGLVSNVGTWMHLVAAQWLIMSLTDSAATVGLLATASSLPALVLALPAGALADVVDRRRVILVSQLWQALTAGALGVITLAGAITPAGLLAATLLLAVGANFAGPAMMAVPIELVDRRHLPAAMSLGSLSGTVSQALGPAVGGLIVAALGSGAVFLLNAASFVGTIVVFVLWRQRPATLVLPAEHVYSAVRTGLHYLASAPDLRRIMLRLGAHVLGFSLVQAVLPLLARDRLHTSSGGYGVLLACMGVGGIIGAAVLPRLRGRFGPDAVTAVGSAVLAVMVVVLPFIPDLVYAGAVVLVIGMANMWVISSAMIAGQSVLPNWVRGRGLAVINVVFAGCIAIGAAAWGAVANSVGLQPAFVAAGVIVALAALLGLTVQFGRVESVDVTLATVTGLPDPPPSLGADDGPVHLRTVYHVDPADAERFREAAARLRGARRRNGAMHWQLASDINDPTRHVESFSIPTWSEHLRQAKRVTEADVQLMRDVAAFHIGPGEPDQEALMGERLIHSNRAHRAG